MEASFEMKNNKSQQLENAHRAVAHFLILRLFEHPAPYNHVGICDLLLMEEVVFSFIREILFRGN
jgi:hypothetical protein